MYKPPPGPPQNSSNLGYAGGPSDSSASSSAQKSHQSAHNAGEPSVQSPPVNDAWKSIPDTSILPPPPASGYEQPSMNNADSDEADRAHQWCRRNPLIFPRQPDKSSHDLATAGNVGLLRPQEYMGELASTESGKWTGRSNGKMKDACLISSLPLYFATSDSPIRTKSTKFIYYEVKIHTMGRPAPGEQSTVALGFCAQPQPTWRLPGWQRASLGIHSDDGHRYINDPWGGKDCIRPFGPGDTMGLGMKFSLPESPPNYDYDANHSNKTLLESNVEVLVTRNGKNDFSWNLREELDHELDQGIDGLDGLFDLHGAVGIFGPVAYSVMFRERDWLWKPE